MFRRGRKEEKSFLHCKSMGGSNSCRTEFRYSVLLEGTANKNDGLDSELNLNKVKFIGSCVTLPSSCCPQRTFSV